MLPGALNSISKFLGCLVFLVRIEEFIQDGSRLFNTAVYTTWCTLFNTADERELNELMQKKFASAQLEQICGESSFPHLVSVLMAVVTLQFVVLGQSGRPHPRFDVFAPGVEDLFHVICVHVHVALHVSAPLPGNEIPKGKSVAIFLVPGPWSMAVGHWSMVQGPWSLDSGSRSLVLGQWSLTSDQAPGTND